MILNLQFTQCSRVGREQREEFIQHAPEFMKIIYYWSIQRKNSQNIRNSTIKLFSEKETVWLFVAMRFLFFSFYMILCSSCLS